MMAVVMIAVMRMMRIWGNDEEEDRDFGGNDDGNGDLSSSFLSDHLVVNESETGFHLNSAKYQLLVIRVDALLVLTASVHKSRQRQWTDRRQQRLGSLSSVGTASAPDLTAYPHE